MTEILIWASTIIALGGAVGVIWKLSRPVVKKAKQVLNSLDRFTRDWEGEEAVPGRDAVPGVMERLNRIDGELKHNGGTSMKDSLRRIEKKISQIDERLEEGNKRFETIEETLNGRSN
jgi:biopolymer transport protein ExbB/TolQ